jgi:large subunit ribosomal protein L21
MPYAIIQTGGKQYRVSQGDRLRVELLAGEPGAEIELGTLKGAGEGESLELDAKKLEGKAVKARILRHGRAAKINIWKFKRRKGYDKRQGHRQHFTEVEIVSTP